ncbi:hypothetical protein AB0I30_31650 [Nocardia tengchongensis]|uniref:hypothetical protein n=1 Tax=Nocardia tengchongensis TaxID=2055889 RepID=UPI0034097B18
MATVEGSHVPVFDRWYASFQDTIEPAPEEGTQSRVVARHDEQALVSGPTKVAQSVQRRIIKIGPPWRTVGSLTSRGFSSLWSNMGILAVPCLLGH